MNKFLLLALTGAFGCNTGPDQPRFYEGVAVSLRVHVADPPGPGQRPRYLMAGLDSRPYCSPAAEDPAAGFNRANVVARTLPAPFDPTAPFTGVTIGSGQGRPCENNVALRFYRPAATLEENGTTVGPWLAEGQDVAWAWEPTTLALFGPDGPQVSLPAGYSVLRSACSGGRLVPTVEPIDTVIELHRPGRGADWSGRGGLEREQAALLAACGLSAPAPDRGTRVSVDAPRTLRWSPDGTRFYYFVPDDAFHVRLRSVPSAGGATSELAVGLQADTLTVPATGEVYVRDNQPGLLRGRPQPDGSLSLEPLPDQLQLVSPDGRWIAGNEPGFPWKVVIHDVMTGQTRDVDGGRVSAWSPDSRRLTYDRWENGARSDTPIRVWNVETGEIGAVGPGISAEWLPDGQLAVGQLDTATPGGPSSTTETVRVVATDGGALGEFHFSSNLGKHVWVGGRLVRLAGLPWVVESVGGEPSMRSQAGLEVEDPAVGTRHTVIPTDRMLLGFPNTDATVVSEGVVLVWARKCLGFYESVCTFELHRLSLADGGDQVVAITPDLTAFALSPDHHRVAIGTRDGIFVKDLP